MSTYIYYGDTLYHHGTKGQKWGVRKYQNEDGSLTPAGREHYGYGQARAKYEAQKMIYKSAKKDARNAHLDAYAYNNRHPISKLTNKNVAKKLNQKQVNAAMYERASKEAKENMKAAKQEYKNSDEYKARQEKIKKAAIAGAAVAATALVAYGAYKINDNKIKASAEKGSSFAAQSAFQATLSTRYHEVYQKLSEKGDKAYNRARIKTDASYREAANLHDKATNYLRRSSDSFYESNRLGAIGSDYRNDARKRYMNSLDGRIGSLKYKQDLRAINPKRKK